jgi:phenylacetic acid degradation operon negative regulatory protein
VARRQDSVDYRGARGYLTTVLGEFVLPDGGRVWTSTLVRALGALGIEERTVRQAVARSSARGLLVPERIGRRTRWQLTATARQLLTEGTRRIYGLHHEAHRWDGRWLLVFMSVPESRRPLRYQLRIRLGWSGLAPIGPGVWLSPWAEREPEVRKVLDGLGLLPTARSFVGRLGSVGDARQLVAEGWDLQEIGAEYQRFLDSSTDRRPSADGDRFVELVRLVHEWRRFPYVDPDLPAELLPRRWVGVRAAAVFHRLHGRWSPGAWDWWRGQAEAAAAIPSATVTGSWNGPK